jgi:IS1 family transposase
MYVLSREQQLNVIHLLVEGNSLRSTARLTGIHRTTIMNLMVKVGEQCQAMLDRWMRNLTLRHLELDEIWTFVQKKQGKIRVTEDSSAIGDMYLFLAVDEDTKLIPSYALGKRTKETTDIFAEDLASRLVLPNLFDDDRPRPQVSTDGWRAYPDSLDMAFTGRLQHGVLIKEYRNTDMPGRYGPPEMIAASKEVISGDIDKDDVCTSHVERHNLTVRTFLKRFTRLALGFSKKRANLAAVVAIYLAHYNFCRWHNSLKMTPAMKAQVTGHPWTLEELLTEAESE